MMMKTAMLTAALVLAAPSFACAQDDAEAAFKRSDKKLNELYRQIEGRLKDDADTKKLLVAAQRAWVGFRDAECTFATSESAGGSVYPTLVASCKDALTQSRVKQFEAYLKCEEGDLSCPVPAAN
jgi:uncharacterized protein YecT (DUF1311 family)